MRRVRNMLETEMAKHYRNMSLMAALAVTACSSTQYQSPIYAHNPEIGGSATTQATSYAQTVNANYNSPSASAHNQECLRQETNRELLGGAIGGTVGAFAGKEFIGGTKGTVAGAALGGIAGYGIGDISTNCAVQASANRGYSNTTYSNVAYQGGTGFAATPANYSPVSCPVGTAAQANGTCMLKDSSVSAASYLAGTTAPAPALISTPAMVSPRYETVPKARQVINVRALATPTPQYSTEVSRTYGASSYQVQPGDTVYSLSRKLCVSVSDIQGSNGLNSNYGIQSARH